MLARGLDMACSHQRLPFDYLSRGLLLFLVLSAAAGEMDHKIAGDRFIMCPAGCVPVLDGGSHAHGKLFERLAEQNGNKVVVVVPDVPAWGAGRLALRPHHDRQQHIDRNGGNPASSLPAGDGAVGVVRGPTLPVDTPTYAGVHRRRPHPRDVSVRSPCIDSSAGWWARTSYQLLPAVIIRSSSGDTSGGAAAGWSHLHIATALSELNSDNNLQTQSSVADRLISLMIMAIMAIGGRRANERRKRTCSSAVVLTMLLVAAAFAESAMAARPLPAAATAGGHDEASASTTPGMPLNEAAAGHSSCTTDPNTQEPVCCIHH